MTLLKHSRLYHPWGMASICPNCAGSDRLRVTPTSDPAVEASDHAREGVHWHGAPSDPDPLTAFPHTGLPYNPSDFAHHLTRRARGMPFW